MADVHENKSLQDLMQEILQHAAYKRNTINSIVNELRQYVTSADDAAVFAPIIKDFVDVSIKNDDQLTKVATIVGRLSSNEKAGGGGIEDLLSEADKEQLLSQVKQETSSQTDVKELVQKVNSTVLKNKNV